MKMFYWKNTDVNRNYTGGDIIVMASDIDAARAVARQHVLSLDWCGAYRPVEEKAEAEAEKAEGVITVDQGRYQRFLDELTADLAKEPTVYDAPAAISIDGGE